jgi:uncharacterized protein YecT (DUF1311 family)
MIGLLALAAAAAGAGAPKCSSPQTQLEINICAGEDFKKADAALNRQWAATSALMRAQDKAAYTPKDGRPGYYQALLDAQRAWLKFRDAQCRVEGFAMRGGSAESMTVSTCLAGVTRARTKQLKDMAAGYQQ